LSLRIESSTQNKNSITLLLNLTMDHYHHYPNNSYFDPNKASSLQNDSENNYSITPAIHRAVFVNNEGTKLVRDSKFDAAVKAFTLVLKILKPLAALVEANDNSNNEQIQMRNDDCILPATVSFSNNETAGSIGNGSSETDIHNTLEFEGFTSLRQSNAASPEDWMDIEPQSPPSTSQVYWHGGISPRPTGRKKQKRVSASAASKLLSVSGPANKFDRREASHFVFRDPVEIPPESVPSNVTADSKGGHSSELFSKFLMIVMYNLALTLHLHALSLSNTTNANLKQSDANVNKNNGNNGDDEKKAKKLFLRSRKLYELAFEMHLDEACDVNLLFTLALVNNLGLVYDVMGQKQRSKTCFKNMFSTMMYLMDSNESHTVKEWDGLLSNVMDILFQQHREIAAPAA